MRKPWILAFFALLLVTPLYASAASSDALSPAAPAAAVAIVIDPSAPPALDTFLATLSDPAAKPVEKATGCGANFCTQAQRDACNQQCISHHHSFFVGLECCSDTCTTLCICGSVPVGC